MIFPAEPEYRSSTLQDLFKGFSRKPCTLSVPVYQRGYEWPNKNMDRIDGIFQNFIDLAASSNLSEINHIGQFVILDEPTTFKIIDGAQRMTTLFCIVSALKRAAELALIHKRVSGPYATCIKDSRKLLIDLILVKANKEFISNNKQEIQKTYEHIVTKLSSYFGGLKEDKFQKKYQLLVTAILFSKVSYIQTNDKNIARDYFYLLNTGEHIKAYEFLKVSLDNNGDYGTISRLNTLFATNKPGKSIDDVALAIYLTSSIDKLTKTDSGGSVTKHKLLDLFKDRFFITSYVDTFKLNSLLTATEKHFLHANSYISSNIDTNLMLANSKTKQFLALMQHDLGFSKQKEAYFSLLFVIEALNSNIAKNNVVLSGTVWEEAIKKYRAHLMNGHVNNELATLKMIVREIYSNNYGYISQNSQSIALSSKTSDRFKVWLFLIELYLNKGVFPASGTYTLEHINSYNGTQKDNTVNNLCLLETSLNSALGKKTLAIKKPEYQKSKLFYAREISNPTNAFSVSPSIDPINNPYYHSVFTILDEAIISILT